ncbi:hypothetical protein LZ30DRAFT_544294, partial [Colletotrichum cereale]
MKYSGERYDVLDTWLRRFRDNCYKAGIPQSGTATAFSIMLRDKAATHYLRETCEKTTGNSPDLATIVAWMKDHSETEESRRAYLT